VTASPIFLEILPTASQEIVEQAHYYRDKADEALANRWQAAVVETIYSLRAAPERGSLGDFKTDSISDLRRIGIRGFPKHLIFYRFIDASRTLVIVSVLHGARDLESLLVTHH